MDFKLLERIYNYKDKKKDFKSVLDYIDSEVNEYIEALPAKGKLKILYGHSFSIYSPAFVHDRILSDVLRFRGAQIIPIYCDRIQRVECNVYGGSWGGSNFDKNCRHCFLQSKLLWKNSTAYPIRFSDYIESADRKYIENKVNRLRSSNWMDFTDDDLPFGLLAKDILVNNHVVGDYRQITNYYYLGLSHLKNLLLLKIVYERILNDIKPDRVVTNDSYYGMWAILQKLSERKKIPFYSHWIGGRQGTWCYAYNDAAMNLNFSKPWIKFSKQPLHLSQKLKVNKWLKERTKGIGMILDTASLAGYKDEDIDFTKFDFTKPTALLSANVVWDLAALNKQIIFHDMMEWITETIKWFTKHPQFQLIVKPHPSEQHPAIPVTKESVKDALQKRSVKIPKNVILLTPKVKMTVYQLFPMIKVGLVHTTTVGIEMVARGIPVITTGRSCYRNFGFTIDPENRQEYFTSLGSILEGRKKQLSGNKISLAYKFILFYNFHYFTNIDILNIDLWEVSKLKVKTLNDILPGKRKHLDYIADSIIEGLPIISHNRWPSES